MTEANLWPLWPSYQSHNMYCLHRLGEVCTQFYEKIAIHFILLRLVQPTWSQFNEACTQFDEKPGRLVRPLLVA